ncbi:hypothetical protein BH20ACT13_BH20ACT13_17360 [soil metagenome]
MRGVEATAEVTARPTPERATVLTDASFRRAQSAEDKVAKACKAERASGAEAFAKKYGTNQNLKNAFGKCVSAKSKAKAKD